MLPRCIHGQPKQHWIPLPTKFPMTSSLSGLSAPSRRSGFQERSTPWRNRQKSFQLHIPGTVLLQPKLMYIYIHSPQSCSLLPSYPRFFLSSQAREHWHRQVVCLLPRFWSPPWHFGTSYPFVPLPLTDLDCMDGGSDLLVEAKCKKIEMILFLVGGTSESFRHTLG